MPALNWTAAESAHSASVNITDTARHILHAVSGRKSIPHTSRRTPPPSKHDRGSRFITPRDTEQIEKALNFQNSSPKIIPDSEPDRHRNILFAADLSYRYSSRTHAPESLGRGNPIPRKKAHSICAHSWQTAARINGTGSGQVAAKSIRKKKAAIYPL